MQQRYDMRPLPDSGRGKWVLWEDVELELTLKDSEIAKLEARIEDLEMEIVALREGD